ncbi:amidohydrolase family protein [Flavobacteriaceae bacterium TP-CH-4]|uniref:Amidohydrolase family protein n=1 Tax=Pelagihabitans pacificus TaxID=2696054 RepID=A0A967B0I7_9FLAO|nr:amidohydrolase family protein [Pelagihabitans pacificus]NHF59891.1 amidohydrolase family protein [Pelagihabitans pacificus]
MKITYSLFLTLISTALSAQDMSFEEYNPTSTLVVEGEEVPRAKFPFIDVHSHQRDMSASTLKEMVADMDRINEAVMVNLSGGSGNGLKSMVESINANYPNRFAVFANVDFDGVGKTDWGAKAAQQLEEDVKAGAKGLKIYKSLGLRYKDTNGNRLAIDDPRLDPIWAKCAELGIPVLIHAADPKSFWDPMDSKNERWLELKTRPRRKRSDDDPAPWQQIIDEQHRMFKKHPKTKFINAHMGWYANNLGKLSELMDEMPNMSVGIGAIIAELGRQPKTARAFFIKYQDRILFGKDSWNPAEFPTYFRVLESDDEYFPYYKKYHAFWAMYGLDLPDDVLRKVYYKNALKLIPGLDRSLFPEE